MTNTNRSGVTLLETTVAMLVLAIGAVAIATLFPMSIVRSIRGTQLTQATILRQNAESLMNVSPAIIFDPDGDLNFHEHARRPPPGILSENIYLIDPMGAVIMGTNNIGSLPRWSLGAATEAVAARIAMLPDSWVPVGEDVPVSTNFGTIASPISPQSLTLPTAPGRVDLATAQAAAASNVIVRAVIFDSSGRLSEVRQLIDTDIDPAAGTIQWAQPLARDSRFYDLGISNVRIETQNRDYTWLFVVRNNSHTSGSVPDNWVVNAEVDVAIFFRRGFDPADEQTFSAPAPGVTHTIINISEMVYEIRWTVGGKPAAKKGGYILDTRRGRWYRIEDTEEGDTWVRFTISEGKTDIQEAVFMRGLVSVHRMGIQEMQLQ